MDCYFLLLVFSPYPALRHVQATTSLAHLAPTCIHAHDVQPLLLVTPVEKLLASHSDLEALSSGCIDSTRDT